MWFPLPYAYSASPAIFRLKLPHKYILEGALHNRIKDFTTGKSIFINYSNSKGRLISVHHNTTIYSKQLFWLGCMLRFLEFNFQCMICWFFTYMKSSTCYLHFNFLFFTFEVSDLYISWLWELQSLASYLCYHRSYAT